MTASEPATETAPGADPSYGALEITVLEGLEAVRERPSMYIGSTGPTGLHHLVWEVVDNSVDEAMAGYCTRIDVTLHEDGSCEVGDDGRGIPTEPHPLHDHVPAAELVMTLLHAGGKFGGDGYKISGGLHGVGVSVVNALSARVEVDIYRSGQRHRMTFVDGGEIAEALSVLGPAPELNGGIRTGTTIRFWPDPSVLEDVSFRYQTVAERLEMMAFLNRGLEIRVRDLRPGPHGHSEWASFRYEGGIVDYVSRLNQSKVRLFDAVGHFSDAETIDGNPHEVEVAFQWNTGFNTDGLHSFANGISTIDGGMHEQGFRSALTRTVNAYAREKGLLKEKAENLHGEDIREGLTAIVSVRIGKPQFEGQTKAKLGNMSMRSFTERVTNRRLSEWLEEHPVEARRALSKAVAASAAREAAARVRSEVRSKSLLDGAGMPDKLKDCTATDSYRRELFIVEGDSAGGSAVRARDPETQAVLPIRGKILNVERARIDRMLKNNEIQAIIAAIGTGIGVAAGPSGAVDGNGDGGASGGRDPDDHACDVAKARYHKVIVLADADVDGSHIRTLLLTFFYRQMRPLVEAGYVYVAQPPLYSTKVSNSKTVYLLDDAAKDAFLAERPKHKREFQRLKGLGEMDWDELRSTTMDPRTRSLLQVSVEEAAIADQVISVLMGDDVEQRKNFIVTNAREVRNLDF
ncbi:MAG: DNA gyrase subunit B [Acidimicrobiaceae bacterium]|nr:DNA gyrase subunit B [Acidimicrobiaceae bacterium]